MLEKNQAVVSRKAFLFVCALAGMLFITLFSVNFTTTAQAEGTSTLNDVVADFKPVAIALISEEAKIKLIDQDGTAIEPCIQTDGAAIPEECSVKGKFRFDNMLYVARYEGSNCMYVRDSAGRLLYTYHIGHPTWKPCHHPQHP